MIRGSTPATAALTIRAIGFRLWFFTPDSEAINKAAAPSFNPDAFPAVTVPSFLKAGFKLLNVSIVVEALANSSVEKRIGSFFFCGMETVVISPSKKPFCFAFAAFSCDQQANRSCASRSIPYFSTRFSAVIPILSTP